MSFFNQIIDFLCFDIIKYIIKINTFNQDVHCQWALTSTTFRYVIT